MSQTARRNSTQLIDGKEQKVAGAIYECVMKDDLPITGQLARRGSVSAWKIDGKDQSVSGALYDYSMKDPVPENRYTCERADRADG